jgi:hypothetical protein
LASYPNASRVFGWRMFRNKRAEKKTIRLQYINSRPSRTGAAMTGAVKNSPCI